MKCPKCDCPNSLVSDSRPRDDDFATLRKRRCKGCNHVYHTVEIFYNKPVKQKVAKPKPKADIKRVKKAQMNKRLARMKRRQAINQIDMMSDEELEEAMFSGQDLKDLGIH